MNLNDAQKQQVAQWLADGMKLGDVQKRLEAEFGVKMTYMEVRFLLDDLKLMPKDVEKTKPVELAAKPSPAATPRPGPPEPPPLTDAGEAEPLPAAPAGGVSVTVDELAVPGAMVSGKVTFSDGQTAQWMLDEMGRLGMATRQKGYRPSAADVQEFQKALERELGRMGM